MPTYTIPTGSLYTDWTIEMVAAVSDESLTFTERLIRHEPDRAIDGFRLIVRDIALFERAAGVLVVDLEDFLLMRKDKLSVDFLRRFCERHGIQYDFSGSRLVTAYRKYFKDMRATNDARQSKGSRLCRKARLRIHGDKPGTPMDIDGAIQLLKTAIDLGYLPAYGQLGKLYMARNRVLESVSIMEQGIKNGDANSMIALADILSDTNETTGIRADYKRAAELYIEASERGYYATASYGLRKLIKNGNYTPKGNQYMRLIMFAAVRTKKLKETILEDHFFDPEVSEAMNMVAKGGEDESKINELLEHAVEVNGKTWASHYLTASYMRMGRWGKAAQMAMKGIEADVTECLFYAARLAEMGADFTGGSDILGKPDYDSAIAWSIKSIEEDFNFGFVMLNHLIAEGHLTTATLPGEVSSRLYDFNVRAQPERININNYDIDCSFIRETT